MNIIAGRSCLMATAAVFLAAGLSACSSDDASSKDEAAASAAAEDQETRLAAVYETCSKRDVGSTLSLEDEDMTIVIDTGSEYGDPSGYACVIQRLDVPSSITAAMDRTTAMMGVQEAEHDGMEFSWSYHPDNGVNMVITDTEGGKN